MQENKPVLLNLDSESLEIIELDDRLDLATDPLFFADNGCCGNSGCICPPSTGGE
jgi:hypothetical protein